MNPWQFSFTDFGPADEGRREALCTLGNGYTARRRAAPESRADDVHHPGTSPTATWRVTAPSRASTWWSTRQPKLPRRWCSWGRELPSRRSASRRSSPCTPRAISPSQTRRPMRSNSRATPWTSRNSSGRTRCAGVGCGRGSDVDCSPARLRSRLFGSTFPLLETVSPNSAEFDLGVPARGLRGEAHRGHIFGDELFILPALTLRRPQLTCSRCSTATADSPWPAKPRRHRHRPQRVALLPGQRR